MPRYVTIREGSRSLGISSTWIRQRIACGDLLTIADGRRTLIEMAALERLIAEHAQPPPRKAAV